MKGHEHFLREQVEQAARLLGCELGPYTEIDDGSAPGLIDFIYNETRPPIALEATSLMDEPMLRAMDRARQVQDELDPIIKREDLGSWQAIVSPLVRARRMKQALLELCRADTKIPSPVGYTSDELLAARSEGGDSAVKELVHQRQRAVRNGILRLRRLHSPHYDQGIGVGPNLSGGWIGSFSSPLEEAIASNAAKLGRAKTEGYESHLGVLVTAMAGSTYPQVTPPPDLPPEVDVLWIFHGWAQSGGFVMWRLAAGETDWSMIEGT